MENSKVSVIIPCYNVEKYIVECIDSIVNQTYKNLEIICINDGSIDNTIKLLENYREKDERIIVISTKNQRQGKARNIGTKLATGKYIIYVDSDDFLEHNIIEKSVNELDNSNAKMVLFSAKAFSDSKNISNERADGYSNFLSIESSKKKITTETVIKDNIPRNTCCKLIDLDWLKENEIYFAEGIIYEDVYFSWSLFMEEPETIMMDSIGYYYRMRDNSTMTDSETNKDFNKAVCHLKNWELLLNRLIKNNTLNKHKDLMEYLLEYYTNYTIKYSLDEDISKINKISQKLSNKLNQLSYTINMEV